MKRRLLVVLSTLFLSSLIVVNAQTSLAGHSYHHPNIMVDAMNDATKDMDKKIAEAKKKTIAEGEKKKGRKLTADEIAKIDKELKEKVEQINAMKKGMKTALTIEFVDNKNLVIRPDIKIDDAALKAAGMGWLKRKALKAALALAPKSEKGTYISQKKVPTSLKVIW